MNRNRKTSSSPRKPKKKKISGIFIILSVVLLGLGLAVFTLFYVGELSDIRSDNMLLDKAKRNLKEIIREDELQYIDEKAVSPNLDQQNYRLMPDKKEQEMQPDYSDKDKNYLDKLME